MGRVFKVKARRPVLVMDRGKYNEDRDKDEGRRQKEEE